MITVENLIYKRLKNITHFHTNSSKLSHHLYPFIMNKDIKQNKTRVVIKTKNPTADKKTFFEGLKAYLETSVIEESNIMTRKR